MTPQLLVVVGLSLFLSDAIGPYCCQRRSHQCCTSGYVYRPFSFLPCCRKRLRPPSHDGVDMVLSVHCFFTGRNLYTLSAAAAAWISVVCRETAALYTIPRYNVTCRDSLGHDLLRQPPLEASLVARIFEQPFPAYIFFFFVPCQFTLNTYRHASCLVSFGLPGKPSLLSRPSRRRFCSDRPRSGNGCRSHGRAERPGRAS